jgi:cbb3-type cytochrome oxidase subunit 3
VLLKKALLTMLQASIFFLGTVALLLFLLREA